MSRLKSVISASKSLDLGHTTIRFECRAPHLMDPGFTHAQNFGYFGGFVLRAQLTHGPIADAPEGRVELAEGGVALLKSAAPLLANG